MSDKTIIGWREWLALPELGVPAIKAKIDTGARTSALHVIKLETFSKDNTPWVSFLLHPIRKRSSIEIACQAPVLDERMVSDSGGHKERRIVIRTPVKLGDLIWPVEITLTNREDMLFRMLLGRTAMEQRLLVDSALSYQFGRSLRKAYGRRPKKQSTVIAGEES